MFRGVGSRHGHTHGGLGRGWENQGKNRIPCRWKGTGPVGLPRPGRDRRGRLIRGREASRPLGRAFGGRDRAGGARTNLGSGRANGITLRFRDRHGGPVCGREPAGPVGVAFRFRERLGRPVRGGKRHGHWVERLLPGPSRKAHTRQRNARAGGSCASIPGP